MNEKAAAKFAVSKDPVSLILKGNSPYVNETVKANLALALSLYREYGFNVAYDAGDDFWLGARAKLLFGIAGANSTENVLSIHTDPSTYAINLTSDLLLKASIPGNVELDPQDGTVSKFNSQLEAKHFILNPINVGGAIDLGVNKTFESGLKVSASLLNIGMINWSTNTHRFYQRATLNYSGATQGVQSWKDLSDTLKSIVDLNYVGGESFSQWLAPEIMAGFSYPVVEYIRLGVTGYAGISSAGVPWALTATALTDNTSMVFGSLSYTVTNNSFVNIGAGLGVRLGAFNLHAITDNILAVFNPSSQKYATIQFGINFKFGCDDDGGRGSRYRSIPCPSFGHHSSRKGSIPCSSGK
jgi:hypothetical protein